MFKNQFELQLCSLLKIVIKKLFGRLYLNYIKLAQKHLREIVTLTSNQVTNIASGHSDKMCYET